MSPLGHGTHPLQDRKQDKKSEPNKHMTLERRCMDVVSTL